MSVINDKKLVLLGAGKIGRSFIGQLFSRGGYEVVFVDSYKPVIDAINRHRKYRVIIKSDIEETLWIDNVRGVHADDADMVASEISGCGILAVSVGQAGLATAMPLIAAGLMKRYEMEPSRPLDIIIAENLRNAAGFFKTRLGELLPPWFPLVKQAGLVETSIGKMVPIMTAKDIERDMLQIFAEPYNTLILDKKAFLNPIPPVEGLAPRENMKAWVDRKLFIHNLGHAAAAYIGHVFNPRYVYMYEPLADAGIHENVRKTMLQAADILVKKYPGEFTIGGLTDHIDDLLRRFQNRALGDTIFRVGCDLTRKLAGEDRLAGAINLALELNLPYDRVLYALVCGFHFRAAGENGKMFPEDVNFMNLFNKGHETVLEKVCGFSKEQVSLLIDDVTRYDRLITDIKRGHSWS